MKLILYTLIFIAFNSSISFAQAYQALIEQGDSLFKDKKYDSSFYTFEKAIEVVTKLNIPVPESVWVRMFMGAGNSADAGSNRDKARKYWNLATGNKGERLHDRIKWLLDTKINSVTITRHVFNGSAPHYLQNCTSDVTTYLLWLNNGYLFVQKFDECENYAPLKFKNPTLSSLIDKNLDQIKLETIKNVNNHGNEEPVYELAFYTAKGSVNKTIKKLNLMDPATSNPHDKNISPATSLVNYKKNMATSLNKLLTAGNMQIKEYEMELSSPSERLKVGKL